MKCDVLSPSQYYIETGRSRCLFISFDFNNDIIDIVIIAKEIYQPLPTPKLSNCNIPGWLRRNVREMKKKALSPVPPVCCPPRLRVSRCRGVTFGPSQSQSSSHSQTGSRTPAADMCSNTTSVYVCKYRVTYCQG